MSPGLGRRGGQWSGRRREELSEASGLSSPWHLREEKLFFFAWLCLIISPGHANDGRKEEEAMQAKQPIQAPVIPPSIGLIGPPPLLNYSRSISPPPKSARGGKEKEIYCRRRGRRRRQNSTHNNFPLFVLLTRKLHFLVTAAAYFSGDK